MKKQNLNAVPELSRWRMKHLGYQVELCQSEEKLLSLARLAGAAQDAQRFCSQISYSHFLLLCPRSNLLVFQMPKLFNFLIDFLKYDFSKGIARRVNTCPWGLQNLNWKAPLQFTKCVIWGKLLSLSTSVFPDIQWDDYLPQDCVRLEWVYLMKTYKNSWWQRMYFYCSLNFFPS